MSNEAYDAFAGVERVRPLVALSDPVAQRLEVELYGARLPDELGWCAADDDNLAS